MWVFFIVHWASFSVFLSFLAGYFVTALVLRRLLYSCSPLFSLTFTSKASHFYFGQGIWTLSICSTISRQNCCFAYFTIDIACFTDQGKRKVFFLLLGHFSSDKKKRNNVSCSVSAYFICYGSIHRAILSGVLSLSYFVQTFLSSIIIRSFD